VLGLPEVVSWDAICDSQEGLEVRDLGALIRFCRCPEKAIRVYVGTGSSQLSVVGIQLSMVLFLLTSCLK